MNDNAVVVSGVPREMKLVYILRPAAEWTEEDSSVLWWHLPICEPPYVGSHECMDERDRDGTPSECATLQRSGHLTHWTSMPQPRRATDGAKIHV